MHDDLCAAEHGAPCDCGLDRARWLRPTPPPGRRDDGPTARPWWMGTRRRSRSGLVRA